MPSYPYHSFWYSKIITHQSSSNRVHQECWSPLLSGANSRPKGQLLIKAELHNRLWAEDFLQEETDITDLPSTEVICPCRGRVPGGTHLGSTSPWPSCPSFPFPQVHTSVRREGRRASASPLYVGVRTTVLVFTRAAFLKSLGETANKPESRVEGWGPGELTPKQKNYREMHLHGVFKTHPYRF